MHADDFTRLDDLDAEIPGIVLGQFLFDRLLLPNQNHGNLPLPGGHDSTGDFMGGDNAPAHGIDCNDRTISQRKRPYSSVLRTSLPL